MELATVISSPRRRNSSRTLHTSRPNKKRPAVRLSDQLGQFSAAFFEFVATMAWTFFHSTRLNTARLFVEY